MSHRAGRPRLVLAAVAAVVGTLTLPSRSPLAAQSSSQDTTGHGAGWGVVYSSPRSRQTATHQVTATPATPQAAAASAPQPPAPASTTGTAAAGWANGAAPVGNAANGPANNPPAVTGRAYAGDPPSGNSYNPGIVSQNSASAPVPAPAPPAYAGRVPGVIYSSNGGVYPPPTRYTAPPAADPPPTTYTAQSYPAQAPGQAPAQAYAAPAPAPTPTYNAAPAQAYNAAPPAQGYSPPSYPAPSYAAPAYPAPTGAYAGGNTMPADRPTNLPPGGKTDAAYNAADTNPPPAPAAGPAPVSASSIHLNELMSLHEWESSGVSRLRPQEIAVLEKWIERYRQQVADSVTRTLQSTPRGPAAAAAAPLPPISRAADGTPRNAHAVVSIRSGSRYITLDDGSVWDVYTSDQTETAAWQQGDLVQVRVAPVAYGDFDHELVNNQRTGPVRAKFMGYAAKQ